jgi:serine phosphatase RsbU (regulator of sigma subunit)/Tfp pilus assembly protein PilF
LFLFFPVFGQNNLPVEYRHKADSLIQIANKAKHDTIRMAAWIELDKYIYEADPVYDYTLNEKIDSLATILLRKKITTKEKKFYLKAKGFALNSFGNYYENNGKYALAVKYYSQALSLRKKAGDKAGIAASLSNIGLIYAHQREFDKAIEYMHEVLEIELQLNNADDIAVTYNNLASLYRNTENNEKALEYFTKGLMLSERENNYSSIAITLSNMGSVYINQKKYDLANDCYKRSFELSVKHNNKTGEINALENLATVKIVRGDYNGAIADLKTALKEALKLESVTEISYAYYQLHRCYEAMGNSGAALEMFRKYIDIRDSIRSEENQMELMKIGLKLEYEKRATADSIRNLEKQKVNNARIAEQNALAEKQESELRSKRMQQYFLYSGLILVIVFSFFLFNRFRITKKQKRLIEIKERETNRQKDEILRSKQIIESKQKEITDSINYAQRIQYSLLAQSEILKKNLKDHFVLFLPKDIVSGDFYWCTQKADSFYLAVCDSTGHGVPGAFMSLLNISYLNEAINEKNIEEPDLVLNYVRQKLIQNMGSGKDGMDAILVKWKNTNENNSEIILQYAAANNHPVVISEGMTNEYPADPMPVGMDFLMNSFSSRQMKCKKGDTLFLFTDGYADQFGGPKGKKMKHSVLLKILSETGTISCSEINHRLKDKFDAWKGDLEQVDDVCIIGIKL